LWKQGVDENINGLILQYFSKRTDFSSVTEQEIRFVINTLNNRPRKTLG
ncbi:IS30 family transposase, partial [Xenorhabdus bovienii]